MILSAHVIISSIKILTFKSVAALAATIVIIAIAIIAIVAALCIVIPEALHDRGISRRIFK